MKTSPLVIGVVICLALAAQGGETNTCGWPCTPTPLEVTTIPVWLELQPWVWVKDVDKLVVYLTRWSANTYQGCVNVSFEARADVNISAEFISNGVMPGKYTCWLNSSVLNPPGGTLTLCVRLQTQASPPPPNTRVGIVFFRVTPRS
ncbi:MAG TPA: hypothetical protein PKH24_11405 [Sedimentisphaerales bacterium]|jgi:hypothetical protein|nr:hypothetical protein [Sedimentisphaerales bacterium]HNU28544.1 hypothetical protein [Sedimentisphaerales bacterium]